MHVRRHLVATLTAPNLHDERYMSSSLRFKEAAFARHFCHAFPKVKRLYAPFWTYDCVAYQLCPRFKNGGACRNMADPYQIVSLAIGLGKLGKLNRKVGSDLVCNCARQSATGLLI